MAGPGKLSTRREFFGTRAQNVQEQARVDQARALNRCPLVDPRARVISVTLVGGTALVVTHGLGVPAAFFVVRQNYDGTGNQTRHPVESATSFQKLVDQNNQLSIVCSDSGTWDLWFYPRSSVTIPTGKSQST